MAIHTFSSRKFHQEPGALKKAAADGPVFITDRGTAQYVLLTKADYDRLFTAQPRRTLSSAMRMPEAADIDFEPIRVGIELREVDLD